MDRIRRLVTPASQAYEPIDDRLEGDDADDAPYYPESRPIARFSRLEYAIFFLLGIAMLWAWNMFLAAAPYFAFRFQSDDWAATHFQSSIMSVSSVTNLATAFLLAKLQRNASYPRRIKIALLINIVIFTLLALSTILLKDITVKVYFGFLMLMVFGSSMATGFNQNGVFAYVSGFGREEYTQAIMAGQGVAGVLPSIVQIISVLAVPEKSDDQQTPQESAKSAFIYFLAATIISACTLVAFYYLGNRRADIACRFPDEGESDSIPEHVEAKTVGLWSLFMKLRWTALAVFLCFTVTMFFPVFTAEIESVHGDIGGSRLFQPAVFIPLALLIWNVGDLVGRMSVLIPHFSLAHRPRALLFLAVARVGFIPLYLLCNIRGRGAVVESDLFYLVIVELGFGLTNGHLASCCMMGANHWVSGNERESTGGFMGLMLVGGLAAGSLLSFLAATR